MNKQFVKRIFVGFRMFGGWSLEIINKGITAYKIWVFENTKIYIHKNSGSRGGGGMVKYYPSWLDLGTISNLLIKAVGQIIRAEDNVLIVIVETSRFGSGGRGRLFIWISSVLSFFFGL